ncbi:MAG TPA: DUF5320 domain-containing protein [Armatimonadota bacterium]|nr:DUF5320 domain-containing protein [Armatimonadota bacterium]
MPRGDGTGPMGMGPTTGRAAGYCAGYGVPGFANPVGGRGLGMARGRGGGGGLGMAWGRGSWGRGPGGGWGFAPAPLPGVYAAPEPTPAEELSALRSQADWLKQQTEAIDARICELQNAKE